MKLVMNIPDYIKEQADVGKGEEFGIPYWLVYGIAKGTPLPEFTERWIPVSERLPEAGEEVLVCGYDTYNKKVIISKYQGKQYGFTCGLVSAWMPLPAPFEPKESDHKCYTCKHYTSGEHDGSCGSYICKEYSNWESGDEE